MTHLSYDGASAPTVVSAPYPRCTTVSGGNVGSRSQRRLRLRGPGHAVAARTIDPSRWIVALRGISIAGVAAALTLAGELQVMQSATILVVTPLLLVLVAIGVNLVFELRKEPYTSTLEAQVRRAVLAHSTRAA